MRKSSSEVAPPRTLLPQAIRKHLLAGLDGEIWTAAQNQSLQLIWGAPPLCAPADLPLRALKIAPLPDEGEVGGRFDRRWPATWLHSLGFAQLNFLYEGETDFRIGVTRAAAQNSSEELAGCYVLKLRAPAVVFLPAGLPHSDGNRPHWEGARGCPPARSLWLRVTPAAVQCHLCFQGRGQIRSEHALLLEDAGAVGMAQLLFREIQLAAPEFENLARAQFAALLLGLRRALRHGAPVVANTSKYPANPLAPDSSHAAPSQRALESVRACDEWMRLHLQEPLTLQRLSQQAGLSPAQLNRYFRAVCGTSAMRYLMRQRVAAAGVMLTETDFSVGEIAHLCGFRSAAHFSQIFAATFHHTPRDYRRANAQRESLL